MLNSIWCECTATFAFSQTVYILRAGPQLQLRIMVLLLRQIRHLSWDVHTGGGSVVRMKNSSVASLRTATIWVFFSVSESDVEQWILVRHHDRHPEGDLCRNLDEGWRLLEGSSEMEGLQGEIWIGWWFTVGRVDMNVHTGLTVCSHRGLLLHECHVGLANNSHNFGTVVLEYWWVLMLWVCSLLGINFLGTSSLERIPEREKRIIPHLTRLITQTDLYRVPAVWCSLPSYPVKAGVSAGFVILSWKLILQEIFYSLGVDKFVKDCSVLLCKWSLARMYNGHWYWFMDTTGLIDLSFTILINLTSSVKW